MAYGIPDSWGTWALRKGLKAGSRRPARGKNIPFSVGASTAKWTFKFDKLVLFEPNYSTYINGKTGSVGRYVRARGRAIVAAAKSQVGVKTGALKKSIHMVHTQHKYGHKLWIGSRLSYAYLHHEGVRPHPILPKKTEVLRFSKGSRVIYSRAVMHPGSRPNRYLSDQLLLAIV